MFNKNKRIKEYMKISNSVKVPNEKREVIKLDKRRNENMNKKAIISTVLAALIGGVVILTNLGVGGSIDGIKVYASEAGNNEEIQFQKGKKIEIVNSFKVIELETETKSGEIKTISKVTEGLCLDVISKDMTAVKLKANKGTFSKSDKKEIENGNLINGEGIVEIRDTSTNEKNKPKDKNKSEGVQEISLDNLNGELEDINYHYNSEMMKLASEGKLNKDTFGKIEINIEATYKNGKTRDEKLILTMDENGKIFGELI